jgi:hypothetical protein
MALKSRKRMGFSVSSIHKRKGPKRYPLHYLHQRSSFWIAALSLFAFITGNLVGQHGWYAFMKSVLGGYDDHLIVYTGTVSPVEYVPDYDQWSYFGGGSVEHTYRQIPQNLLKKMPVYKLSQKDTIYSIGHLGSYATGIEGEGSHPGIDIRVPIGTPIQSIANGIVEQVREDRGGFGRLIVLRHPHVPDPLHPKTETTLHSVYAHLSAQFVSKGQIVRKGDIIGLSGNTGFVTGPHLHFQIDRDDAPFHPYWPFTMSEARSVGLTLMQAINRGFHKDRGIKYTVNPMLYIQANYPPFKDSNTVVADESERMIDRRDERKRLRLSRAQYASKKAPEKPVVVQAPPPLPPSAPSPPPTPTAPRSPVISKSIVVAQLGSADHAAASSTEVTTATIEHDGGFRRGWETIEITLLDSAGRVVRSPSFSRDLYLRTAYGDAEFRPASLSSLDFTNGRARVKVLPRGRRTVVIAIEPFGVLSNPLKYLQR